MARIEKPCKRCKGKGKIVSGNKADHFYDWPLLTNPAIGLKTCPTCHGKGSK
jgi:DnaJ-class molecular chaperone